MYLTVNFKNFFFFFLIKRVLILMLAKKKVVGVVRLLLHGLRNTRQWLVDTVCLYERFTVFNK